MQSQKKIEVARQLSQLLIRSADLAKSFFASVSESLEVPPHLAMAILLLEEPAPMGELSQKMARDKSYITQVADQLESLGLLERVPGEDRRTKLLALTSEGKKLRLKLAEVAGNQSPIMTALNEEERALLSNLLSKILG